MAVELSYDDDLDQALALHEAGRLDEAEVIYRRILESAPDDPDALNLLGLLLQHRGDFAQSIVCLNRALEIDGAFPEALANLARVELATGQFAAAATHAANAVALDPELVQAYLVLGRAQIEQREYTAAEHTLNRALRLNPDADEAKTFLGMSLARQGRCEEAIVIFDAVLAAPSATAGTAVLAGSVLVETDRLDKALDYLRHATALAPADASAHAALARAHLRAFDPVSCAQAAQRSLELDANQADIWLLMGSTCASAGDFDAAEACYKKTLTLDPASAGARRALAVIGRQPNDVAEKLRLRSILEDAQTSEAERVAAGFGLATMLDQTEQYDDAFVAFQAANHLVRDRMAREGQAFSLPELRTAIDWLIRTFDQSLFENLSSVGDRSRRPVFIVGMPRSGTSLVEQIVASHPAVFGGGERKDIGVIVRSLDGGSLNVHPTRWNQQATREAARAYIARITELSPAEFYFTDKLPDNIAMLGHIAVLFPNARIIYCHRDLRDNALSAWFQHFGDGMTWSYDLSDCAARSLEIDRLAKHWHTVLPLRMLDVRYEDVVADLEGESRRMIDFLGLPWDPACLAFHQTRRAVLSASFWQVRQPLYASAVGRWSHYRTHLAPLLLGLIGSIPEPTEEQWKDLVADRDAAVSAARVHFDLGRPAAADSILTAISRWHSRDADTWNLLGKLKLQNGETEAAVALLSDAVDADRSSVPRLTDLVRALLEANHNQDAADAARLLTTLDPESAEPWVHLGTVLGRQKDWPGAIAALTRAAEIEPDEIGIMSGLAIALSEHRDFGRAQPLWQRILDAEPDNSEAMVGLSIALAELGLGDECLPIAEEAAANSASNPNMLLNLARVYLRINQPRRGLEIAQAGLKLAPDLMGLWILQALMQGLIGDFDGADKSYRRALELDPESGAAYVGLMRVGKVTDTEDLLAKTALRIGDASADAEDRISAAFAAAAAYDKKGDYDAAFEAYLRANTLAREIRTNIDPEAELTSLTQIVEWAIKHFDDDTFLNAMSMGNMSTVPVFITGMPRSGTTLVEQIAASHPSVVGLGERSDIPVLLGAGGEIRNISHPSNWDAREMHEKTAALVKHLQSHDADALRVINKLPDNILWLGQIAVLFPRAPIIICRRDLRDVCWSAFSQDFLDAGMAWSYSLEDCARRARLIDTLTDHWIQTLPVPVHELHYESLVNDLEGESRRLIDFLGLPWDPACLSFHQTQRDIATASVWQVRQPLYSSSVGRWKRYRKHLSPLLDGLKGLVPEDD